MAIYLGIDSGYVAPGFVVIDWPTTGLSHIKHAECFRTKGLTGKQRKHRKVYKSHDDARRCIEVSDRIELLVRHHRPDAAVVELPSAGAKSAGAIKGMALGAATTIVTLHRLGVPAHYITPGANKAGSTTDREAQKDAVLAAVKTQWPDFVDWPRMKRKDAPDLSSCWAIADAASCVLTHLTS